ncbi:MAG TPA: ABC transporter permease [Chitinophagaceae bacterium]|nr:ABC transporter permease [Chitinophagaceae bacterium]
MLKNYLTIAWRNLIKSKVYSSINIAGLAVGMSVAMLISLWIWDELSFNKHFKNYDRIVRVYENSTHSGVTNTFNSMPIPLANEFRTKYGSDFKRVALCSWEFSNIFAYGDKKLSLSGMFAQPDFPAIISLNMIKGNLRSINDPTSIILNQSTARALFGDADPMNKLVKINNKATLKVTGIFEDLPYNGDFRDVTYLASWMYYENSEAWIKNDETEWDDNSFQIYAQLADNVDVNKVDARVKKALEGHNRKDKPEVLLHPMAKWHLYGEFKNGKNTGGNIEFVWMFGIIGLFVLLLACINFMNLSTARSEKRAKEVGIRKAVGSVRRQLVFQFLSESVLIALIAFVVSLLLTLVALPGFNKLADKHMSIMWDNGWFWLASISFSVFTGIISGSYPALYLSSFNSVKVLKGTFKAGRLAAVPRKVLVVLQFSVSVALIIGTVIIFQQIQYAKNRPIGFSRNGLITIDMNTPELYGHYGGLRDDLLRTGAVEDMAESSSPTTGVWSNQSGFDWRGKDPNMVPTFGTIAVTHDFGKTVGWQFVAGRDFSRDYQTDSSAFIINEAAVKYMGFKDAVGEIVKRQVGENKYKDFHVIGVIKNMVMESPFDPVKPTIFLMDYEWANVITVKLNPKMSPHDALPKVETVFKKYNPGSPFLYRFEDDEYAKKFSSEERVSSLATFFAIFAIFISCLGLFGLASFTAEQRTKEIGVRKVLGASVLNLWGLLSKDFVVLVFISFFIAVPVAWYGMSKWLLNYDYRTTISAWVFVATAAAALIITMITVSFQAVKAALSNPVKSLRTE